jgi:hypothetical protein
MNPYRLVGRHSRSTYERILIVAALSVLIATTSGCAASAPSTTTRTIAARPSLTTILSKANTDLSALRDWTVGAAAPSYQQSMFWRRAARSLSVASTKDSAQRKVDQNAAAELRQLASLPETSDTPSQRSTSQRDVAELNAFFGTKNLYQ